MRSLQHLESIVSSSVASKTGRTETHLPNATLRTRSHERNESICDVLWCSRDRIVGLEEGEDHEDREEAAVQVGSLRETTGQSRSRGEIEGTNVEIVEMFLTRIRELREKDGLE
jgi:hypothetical protein